MPLIDPTAEQLTFKKFYHYQAFNKQHLIGMFCDQMLYFSDPANINDPWDCKPWFDYRPMIQDPQKCEEMIAAYQSALSPETLNHPLRLQYENRLRTNPDALKKHIEDSSISLITKLKTRRIYCLTPFPDNALMWSHYGDKHKGICLEFAKDNPLIRLARPIRYRTDYPEWTPQLFRGSNPLELMLTKAMDWSYEREFRIFASALEGPNKLYGNFVKLPPGALTAIIIGCENKQQAEIIETVRAHAPGLPIMRVVRAPNVYKLLIQAA